jgi:hypothetical protein
VEVIYRNKSLKAKKTKAKEIKRKKPKVESRKMKEVGLGKLSRSKMFALENKRN